MTGLPTCKPSIAQPRCNSAGRRQGIEPRSSQDFGRLSGCCRTAKRHFLAGSIPAMSTTGLVAGIASKVGLERPVASRVGVCKRSTGCGGCKSLFQRGAAAACRGGSTPPPSASHWIAAVWRPVRLRRGALLRFGTWCPIVRGERSIACCESLRFTPPTRGGPRFLGEVATRPPRTPRSGGGA